VAQEEISVRFADGGFGDLGFLIEEHHCWIMRNYRHVAKK